MATNGHSHEQGLRVHHLANLGGLVAIAGLDHQPPDFLLGALLSLSHESATLDPAKRARKSWSRAKELHSVTLSSAQVREIIEALHEHAPENSAQLIASLSTLLTEPTHEPA